MKSIIKFILLPSAFVAVMLASCDDKDLIAENDKWIFPDTTDVGYIRVIHSFAAIAPQIPNVAANTGPQVFIYADGAKLNGTNLSYAGNWPSPNVYATVKTGAVNFMVVLARMNTTVTPNVPAPAAGDTLLQFTQNIERGKYYSMILVDTTPTMRIWIKEDDLAIPEVNKYRIRLVNTTGNPSDTLELYSRVMKQTIVTGVTHKKASNFVEIALPPVNDTLEVRKPGGTAAIYYVGSQAAPQTFAPVSQRIYSVVCRGKTGVATKTPSSTLVTNR